MLVDGNSFFFLIFSSHCGSQLYSTVLLLIFFKISFVFSRRKKLIQVWKNFGVKKWWQSFIFGGELSLYVKQIF